MAKAKEAIELKSKTANEGLKALGVTLIPVDKVAGPTLNLFGIEETKDVAIALCGIVNSMVNKAHWTKYLGLVPDIVAAAVGIEKVPSEIIDITDEEFEELKVTIKMKLDFEGPAAELEEIAENIAVHVIGIVLQVVKIVELRKPDPV